MALRSTDDLRITFLGGAASIGASAALVEAAGLRLLVDCGVRFEPGNALPDLSQIPPGGPDAVLVTHAHSDHTGALPVIHGAFPGVPVYATPPTIDLVSVLFRDALKLMNGPDREADVPLYTEAQVESLARALQPAPFEQPVRIGEAIVTWLPAGHILGAAMVHLQTPAGSVLFTGDYSVSAQLTVPALNRPAFEADVVVSEATYGCRLHEDRSAAEERLVAQVRTVLERGGRVLVPAFAIGRAQEVILILRRALKRGRIPGVPVYVDGMVKSVCEIYRRWERYTARSLARNIRRLPHPFYGDRVSPVSGAQQRAQVLAGGPCVIVASSGMLAGGASAHYARAMASCERDAILITGYQDEESPGRALLELAEGAGSGEVRIGGQPVAVSCEVGKYGLSAHADRLQMTAFLEALRPGTVILVHSDEDARSALAGALSTGDAVLPADGQPVETSRRRGGRNRPAPLAQSLHVDPVRARNLLGPPGNRPLAVRDVAGAWFGRRVPRLQAEALASQFERLGLVRRDDNRRGRLWVLAPGESDLFPEEAALERELKAANPKGRLLELCMRLRCDPPEVAFEVEGAFHVAVMSLEYDGRELRSAAHRAASRRTAEQLAAAEMLELFREESGGGEDAFTRVDGERARQLRAANPKGRLLELCAARRRPAPEFELRAHPDGYAIRALMPGGAGPASGWFVAARRKTAEGAAAAELLELLELETPPAGEESSAAERQDESGSEASPRPEASASAPAPGAPSAGAALDARALLNEMLQQGLIAGFGYDESPPEGPAHRPVFRAAGWADLTAGRRLEGAPVEGPSRKAARREAAAALVDALAADGLVAATCREGQSGGDRESETRP